MIGAIAGDIIGSPYEGKSWWMEERSTDFELFNSKCRFTDDTVLTICICDYLMNGGDLIQMMKDYTKKYPVRYGPAFKQWAYSESREPYGSYGNGSAMRISSVPYLVQNYDEMQAKVEEITCITHNHKEGISGAQAVAAAIFYALSGDYKSIIKKILKDGYKYDLDFSIDQIRPTFKFDPTCQGTVPAAIVAFLESEDYEHAIRLAVSLGGDTDTLACITGSIAAAYHGIPKNIADKSLSYLDDDLMKIVNQFRSNW